MNANRLIIVPILAAVTAAACNAKSTEPEQRVAELEKQLADTQKQLAETTPASAAQSPAQPAQPPEIQKSVTADQAAKSRAEAQLLEQQKAVNQRQAEANVRLQEQVDRLKPREFVLPVGTVIPIRTASELTTAKLSDGSVFEAHLEHDLKSGDTVIAKARSRVTGFVISSDPGGRVKGTASLTVGVRSLVGVNGNVISITTDPYAVEAGSTKKKDAVRTGVATGVGAAIGGIAGGGSGAAKGAGVGAAAGIGVNLATRGAPAVIPAEEFIEFRLTAPVKIVMQP
jgi:hypothetical protein